MTNIKNNTSFKYLLLFSITLLSINQLFLLSLINLSEHSEKPAVALGNAMSLLTISKIIALPISGYFVDIFNEKKNFIL